MNTVNILISGTGSYIPEVAVPNTEFSRHTFFDEAGQSITTAPEVIARKFEEITGIAERRYAMDGQQLSDLAVIAAERAIADSGADSESLDAILLAHNFGDIIHGTGQVDVLPSIASRVKHALRIQNPDCVAFDVLFGCPGWLQGVILAKQYISAGDAKRVLVVGAETLSRVLDPHDRDSMIYADGAGAAVLEARAEDRIAGIRSSSAQTHSLNEAYYLFYGLSNNKQHDASKRYLKMYGRKIYEFALKHVPMAMKKCLDKSGYPIEKLKKIFIHQANRKMDEAILKAFYKLYGIDSPPDNVMPMNIHFLGNSSVATIPTLLDSVLKDKEEGHSLHKGDLILFASVGAGMNINAVSYII